MISGEPQRRLSSALCVRVDLRKFSILDSKELPYRFTGILDIDDAFVSYRVEVVVVGDEC